MRASRLILAGVVSLCVFAGSVVFGGVARAALTHDYLSQVTEVPVVGPHGEAVAGPGPLQGVESVTFDSGHLWVSEEVRTGSTVASRVDEFSTSTGAFISQPIFTPGSPSFTQFGVAVGHGGGEGQVYLGGSSAGAPVVSVFDEAGVSQGSPWTGVDTPAGSFGEFDYVTSDNSSSPLDWAAGDVYVAAPSQKVIDVFRPLAKGGEEYVTQLTGVSAGKPFGLPFKMVVDQANGDLLVADSGEVIDVFEPTGLHEYASVGTIAGPPPDAKFGHINGLAVDGGSGEVYVVNGNNPAVVDEFSLSGAYLGRITGVGAPGGDLRGVFALAVDPASHNVYVADNRSFGRVSEPSALDFFSPNVVVPDVATGVVSALKARSATLTGTVNPAGGGDATCAFEWGASVAFGEAPAPCSVDVPDGESPVPVQASLTGLESDTGYCYRLRASNSKDENPGETWQNVCFTTLGPGVHSETVSAVTAESVTFDAAIVPHGARTSYYFQYGTTSAYGTSLPAAPGIAIGSGEGDVEVGQHTPGLQAGTVYHYRVVVLSEVEPGKVEEFDGPDQTFTTQIAGGGSGSLLLDERSWEMVTPPQKRGALFFGLSRKDRSLDFYNLIQASANGDAIVDLASQPTEAEPQGYSNVVSVLSTRGSGGWSSQVIAPPHDEATGPAIGPGLEYRFFSEDLSRGIVQPLGNFTPLSPEASESTAYLRTDYVNGDVSEHCQTSCFQPLVTAANTNPGARFGEESEGECPHQECGPFFEDATPDLSHALVSSGVQLTSQPAPNGRLYEWFGGQLRLVSVLPEGEEGKANTLGIAGALGNSFSAEYGARHAISDDGGRVILARREGTGLYLRDVVKGETIRLDVRQGGASDSERPEYMTASSDGSRVFFLDRGHLTPESSASGPDLYEYDLDAPAGSRLTDLTVDRNAGEPAMVRDVLGGSEDGSYVYFVAAGALTPDAPQKGECQLVRQGTVPPAGKESCNVYVYHDGVTRLVASRWAAEESGDHAARVSPDGRWLTFMSNRSMTNYDTHDAISGHPDEEVYLYGADSNELICASCNPTGARPTGIDLYDSKGNRRQGLLIEGDLGGKPGTGVAANVPPWTEFDLDHPLYQPRYLADGGRLFFDSSDALVPRDVNGTEDVYEYEPAGVGSCSTSTVTFSASSNGCVNLISSGTSPEESVFLDASETGGDVFFLTKAKLVSQDFDLAFDVYDAHECTTSVPCYPVPPAVPPVCSTGDACKAAPSPQPSIFGPAPSATFTGAGNVSPSESRSVVKQKSLTRAQKLARALHACRKKRHAQRAVCKRSARRRYGTAATSRKAGAKRKGGR